ncbi:MAG: hypothetical protein Sapg2KO_48590 [Saprospiraceae bacterium]
MINNQILFIGLISLSGFFNWSTTDTNCKNSIYLLDQVKTQYDPNGNWDQSALKIHIEEPRVGNPQRHTKLHLDNSQDYFEMERFREDGIVKRILNGDGTSEIFLNGESDLPKSTVDEYRLYVERSQGHKQFYKLIYGLPMSLTDQVWQEIKPAETAEFEGKEVYRISLELKDAMISQHWTLIVELETFKLLALEFNHPEDPNGEEEIIKFEGAFEIDGIKLPRIRNWYIKGTNEYLGSDLIIKELK